MNTSEIPNADEQAPVTSTGTELSPQEYAQQMVVDRLTNSINFYNQAPADNELNMVAQTRQILLNAGIMNEALAATYDNHRFILEAQGKHAHAQQFLLNRWLNEQFSYLDAQGQDTRLYRYQLVYEIKPSQWLIVLENSIAPNFAELGLPYIQQHG